MMKKVDINVFTRTTIGKIKKLNGGNLAPPLRNENAGVNIRESFAALNMPLTRLHDAPLENGGMHLVDVQQIFPFFHLDAADERNYYFRQTDDYIKNCIEGGTQILYRLGASIEHSVNKYFIDPPRDVDKWIEVCSHIIRHYTEGWADGFFFDIRYWEIWNEPECTDAVGNHLMWSGSLDEFNIFYVKTAKALKERFPHLKIGGPAHCWFGDHSEIFLEYCYHHQAPLDFYSYHCYTNEPYLWIQESTRMVRAALDRNGYPDAEIHLNEWHYFPGDWIRLRADPDYSQMIYREMKGIHAAAYLCSVMALWQDEPIDMGCYYTTTTTKWGLYEDSNVLTKAYYGMKAFGEIVRYPERIKTTSSDASLTVLGGTDSSGNLALLFSGFKCGQTELSISFDDEVKINKVLLLDEQNNLDSVEFRFDGTMLSLLNQSESMVGLILF